MVLYVAALILVVLVWTAAWALSIPYWVPALLTAFVVFALLSTVAIRRLIAVRKAKHIEKALSAQSSSLTQTMRPDLAAEIESMSAEFHRAVGALKSSKLKGGGTTALYALPWYVIIGPPGAGKSTAIRNSGLNFPYVPSQSRGSVKGIGGTRNCDWWLSNEAVLLDTAGRWTTQDDDHEWSAFLGLLKKWRARRPLDGLLVAIGVDELLNRGHAERAQLAAKVRERIDEVMERLGFSLPVYVVVTKCDLLPGFTEMFSDMARSDRGQLLGYTLPLREHGLELYELIDEKMRELTGSLEHRAMCRLGNERRTDAREAVVGFPSSFGNLREPLADFVAELFQPNVYRQTPMMRGAYFTSGTQEGTPIDRMLGQLAQASGLPLEVRLPEPVLEPKSYFLRSFFDNVLLRDVALASPTDAALRRRNRVQIAGGISLCALSGALILWTALAWRSNEVMLTRTRSLLSASSERQKDEMHREAPLSPRVLDELRNQADTLRSFRAEGAPWSLRAGLYQGDALVEPVTRAYSRAMRDRVIAPLVRRDAEELDAWGKSYEEHLDQVPASGQVQAHYLQLERYLRLTAPRAWDEPEWTREAREALLESLVDSWRASTAQAAAVPVPTVRNHIELFLDLMAEDPTLLLPRNNDAVRRARLGLMRLPASEVALDHIVHELDGLGYELTLARAVGALGANISAREHIRGAFTRRAWEERVREAIDRVGTQRDGEAWVLGTRPAEVTTGVEPHAMRESLRQQYFSMYIEEWQRFLAGLRIKSPSDENEALALIEDLTRGDPALLRRLVAVVEFNSQLFEAPRAAATPTERAATLARTLSDRLSGSEPGPESPEGGEAERAAPVLASTNVRSAFAPLVAFGIPQPPAQGSASAPVALDIYQEQLVYLREALSSHRDNQGGNEDLLGRLATARTRVQSLIAGETVGWRPLYETLLWPAIDGAATTSTHSMAGAVGRSWCSSVAVPFFGTLAGRYPFDPEGHDAALSDFAAFYKAQGGIVGTFYDTHLSEQVVRDGSRFVFATRLGQSAGDIYRSTLPLFLERSEAIRSAFFPPGSTDPRIEFDVRIRPVPRASKVRFETGGTAIDHRNGPETWSRVVWPGEDAGRGATIEVEGANGLSERLHQDGDWGLFRLLERASQVAPGAPGTRTFTATWRLPGNGLEVTIDLRPVRTESPFFAAGTARNRVLAPVRAVGVQAPRVITGAFDCSVGG